MLVETVESWKHHLHRNFDDVILFFVIGVILLALLPPKNTPMVSTAA